MEALEALIPTVLFYMFAFALVAGATMVITARNAVYSVLFLIFCFFNAAGLFVLIGAEYLAMTLVIVYVGAVAVLFLFVVMMLNVNYTRFKEGFTTYLPLGLLVAAVIFVQLALAFMYIPAPTEPVSEAVKNATNTTLIGHQLYTEYVLLFQIAGLILLVAMIGAIVLTHRQRPGVKKQSISKQLARNPREAVTLVDIDADGKVYTDPATDEGAR